MQKLIRLILLSGCLGLAGAAWACDTPVSSGNEDTSDDEVVVNIVDDDGESVVISINGE